MATGLKRLPVHSYADSARGVRVVSARSASDSGCIMSVTASEPASCSPATCMLESAIAPGRSTTGETAGLEESEAWLRHGLPTTAGLAGPGLLLMDEGHAAADMRWLRVAMPYGLWWRTQADDTGY